MADKSFFKERSVAGIRNLGVSQVYRQKGLIDKIVGLDPAEEGLIVRAQIIPGKYSRYKYVESSADASRACLKYGDKMKLHYPVTKGGANRSSITPVQVRAEEMGKLEGVREDEINVVGIYSKPEFGDKTARVFPFVNSPIGMRLFAYAETMTAGVNVNTKYKDVARARTDGVEVLASVPSRTKKHSRYRFKLLHVPMIRAPENLATVQMLKPSIVVDDSGEPEEGRTEHERHQIQYGKGDNEDKKPIIYQPQDVAAYLGIVKEQWGRHNLTPMEMNPFPLFSRKGADIDRRVRNNVLIFDPTLTGKHKLRKLHLAERSILLARAIGKFGHDEIAYWEPGRDGKIKDYDWSVGDK
jgi:hypothetical protein